MTKTINWPACFRDEIIEESTDDLRVAFRLGRLYYDNHYWVAGDIVNIRANHRIIRQAVIYGELKCCRVKDLEPQDYTVQKKNLKTMVAVIDFLSNNYNQSVTEDSEITAVYYKNLPLDPNILDSQDDPHLS